MKKEYVWFSVLLLAAALIVGFTLSIALNFKYISQQVIASQKQQEAQEAYSRIQPAANNLEVKIPSSTVDKAQSTTQSTNNQTSNAANQQTSTGVSSGQSSSNTNDAKLMVVNASEKQEIENMLNTVGIPANQDYSQRVKAFQSTISLPATGIMDAQTLQALIQKTTINKANQQLGR